MTAQLGAIVEYVDLLGQVDTDGVEPLAHALDVAERLPRRRAGPSCRSTTPWPTLAADRRGELLRRSRRFELRGLTLRPKPIRDPMIEQTGHELLWTPAQRGDHRRER